MKPILIIGIIISLLLISSVGIALTTSDTWTGEESLSDKVSNTLAGNTLPDESAPEDVVPSDTIDSTISNEKIDLTDSTENANLPDNSTSSDELPTNTDSTTTDSTGSTDSASDVTTPTVHTAPLNPVATSIRIKSALPLSNAFWGYDTTPKYVYLANARIITHQDSFEIGEKDYKVETKTQGAGYTPYIPLEEKSYSEWNGVKGKMKIYIQHPDIISNTGAVSLITDAPTTKNTVKVISLIPDTYAISTILKKVDNNGLIIPFSDRESAATIKIVELNACTGATSKDWVLGSLFSYNPEIEVYLSSDFEAGSPWKKQTIITKDAFDTNDQMHVLLHPQILTAEHGYTLRPFDMHTKGSKEFYAKFVISGSPDKIFKITFDITSTKITNLIFETIR